MNDIANDMIIDFKNFILPILLQLYPTCVIDYKRSNAHEIRLRLILENAEEAENFKHFFSHLSYTNWAYYSRVSNPQRVIYSKTWICQLSGFNKKCETKRNASCGAKLKIKIKKMSAGTVKNDEFLKLRPPLTSEVIISLLHTHNVVSEETLRMLRVDDDVKKQFFEYFAKGMSPAGAIRLHEKYLLENNFNMANASLNPTSRQVYYMHTCWKTCRKGGTDEIKIKKASAQKTRHKKKKQLREADDVESTTDTQEKTSHPQLISIKQEFPNQELDDINDESKTVNENDATASEKGIFPQLISIKQALDDINNESKTVNENNSTASEEGIFSQLINIKQELDDINNESKTVNENNSAASEDGIFPQLIIIKQEFPNQELSDINDESEIGNENCATKNVEGNSQSPTSSFSSIPSRSKEKYDYSRRSLLKRKMPFENNPQDSPVRIKQEFPNQELNDINDESEIGNENCATENVEGNSQSPIASFSSIPNRSKEKYDYSRRSLLKRKMPFENNRQDSPVSQILPRMSVENSTERGTFTLKEPAKHPIDVFLSGISLTLKSLNPELLNKAKSKICDVVQQCEMEQLRNCQSQYILPLIQEYHSVKQ